MTNPPSATRGQTFLASAATLALAAALCAVQSTPALAASYDLTPPPDGCLAADSAAVALEDTTDVQTTTLDVAGPVLQVIVEWAGIWAPAPTDPTIGIAVTGPEGTQTGNFAGTESTDPTGLSGTPTPISYGYHADITALFGTGAAGTYTVDVTPPVDGVADAENNWWGATITAIYDSTPCAQTSTAIWKTGTDFYYGGNTTSSPTTDLIVYDWGYPLPADTTATFRASQGGSDDEATTCRVTSIWVDRGAGTAPAATEDLVDDSGIANPAYGGDEGIIYPFTPPNQPCPALEFTTPVGSVAGGAVGPGWGSIEFDLALPAGATWAALQFESPQDNGANPGLAEDAAWAGSGLLLLPALNQPEPPVPGPADTLPATGGTAAGIPLAASAAILLAGALLLMMAGRRRRGRTQR